MYGHAERIGGGAGYLVLLQNTTVRVAYKLMLVCFCLWSPAVSCKRKGNQEIEK